MSASNKVSIEIVEGTIISPNFVNGQEQFQTDFNFFSVDVKKRAIY
jgi:hypothetical protein